MTKKELVQEVQRQMIAVGLTNNQTGEVITHATDLIRAGAHQGPVTLRGFGTFKMTTKKARTGRNPKTGELIEIPEKRVLTFKPAP